MSHLTNQEGCLNNPYEKPGWRQEICQQRSEEIFKTKSMIVLHMSCLSQCSIAVKRRSGHSNSYKRKHLTGACTQFRGLLHYHRGGKHGGTQVDMVLEREARVLHLDPQAATGRGGDTGPRLSV